MFLTVEFVPSAPRRSFQFSCDCQVFIVKMSAASVDLAVVIAQLH